jgi:hypothetical protein
VAVYDPVLHRFTTDATDGAASDYFRVRGTP